MLTYASETSEYVIGNVSSNYAYAPLSPAINKKYQLSPGFTDFFFIMTVIIVCLISSGVISLTTLGGDQVSFSNNHIKTFDYIYNYLLLFIL